MARPELSSIGFVIILGVSGAAATVNAQSEGIVGSWSIGTDQPSGGDIVLELDADDDGQVAFCGTVDHVDGVIEVEGSMALSSPIYVSVSMFAQNLTNESQVFEVVIGMPTGTYPESTLVGGSIIGSITGGADSGGFDLADDAPLLTAMIDDRSVGELISELPEPIVSEPWATAVIGPASFGDPIPSAPAPAVGSEVGLQLKFELSPGSFFVATAIFACEPVPCTADLDGSGAVDGSDLGVLLANWGGSGAGDLNADGVIDGADLGQFLAGWGGCG